MNSEVAGKIMSYVNSEKAAAISETFAGNNAVKEEGSEKKTGENSQAEKN